MYFMHVLYIFKLNTHMKATPGFLYLMILIQIDILTVDIMMKTILLSLPSYCSISPVVKTKVSLVSPTGETKIYADNQSRKSKIRESNRTRMLWSRSAHGQNGEHEWQQSLAPFLFNVAILPSVEERRNYTLAS